MKKKINLLFLISPLLCIGQIDSAAFNWTSTGVIIPEQKIVYFNNFEHPLNETMYSQTGVIVEFDSTNMHLSYDGTPAFLTNDGMQRIHMNISNPIYGLANIDTLQISMRVKQAEECDSYFKFEYTTNNKNFTWVTLYEGNPKDYYHLINMHIPVEEASTITVRFFHEQIEGCGSYYVDDIMVKGNTPSEDGTCVFDSNEDGNIDFQDLLNLLTVYGSICE